ncbi:MFS transporter [Cutibacterium sp. WCA-380-WT-3A]|uniref:MFS transporter n=1 Tax=Cutibacterium porci TaxID=2605781 RepID=A0A7K0J568_9ACTN|nr:MFS transporter [Cutibacterium porci]MSS45091.1 MFS transporter [Cutibacterium porci]
MAQTKSVAELTDRDRRITLLSLSMVLFVSILDISAVNVMLPSIGRDLHATTEQLQWVVDIFMVVLASILMFAGSMGDRFGRRRALIQGLTIFGLGSLLSAIAIGPQMLIAARAVQALGGATMPPVALAIIGNVFLDNAQRARAIGVWGAIQGISLAVGPLIGGVLTDVASWRWVFGINVPIVAITGFLIMRTVPETKAAHARKFDPAGQVLAMVLLVSLSYAIIRVGEHGSNLVSSILFAVAALSLAGFVVVERTVNEPMLELRFFKSMPFTLANLIALFAFASNTGFSFINALFLQNEMGFSPLAAGAFLVPMAICTGALAMVSGRMVAARGARPSLILHAILIGLSGGALLTTASVDNPWIVYLIASILLGSAMGAANAALNNTALSGMPRSQAGVAGATMGVARQTGQAVGVAIFGALYNAGLRSGTSAAQAALPNWWIMVGSAAIILTLAIISGTPWARSSENTVAELIAD